MEFYMLMEPEHARAGMEFWRDGPQCRGQEGEDEDVQGKGKIQEAGGHGSHRVLRKSVE